MTVAVPARSELAGRHDFFWDLETGNPRSHCQSSGKTSWLARDCPLTVSLKDLYFPQSGKEGCMLGKRDPGHLFLEVEGL